MFSPLQVETRNNDKSKITFELENIHCDDFFHNYWTHSICNFFDPT